MTKKVIAGFPRQTSKFTVSSDATFDPDYPITNVQTDEYARIARTTDNDEFTITGTSTTPLPMRCFAICAHNGDINAEYQLKIYDDSVSPSELLVDTGLEPMWPSAYGYAGRIWETFNFWTGQYSDDELDGQIPQTTILLDELVIGHRWELTIKNPTNPASEFDIGLIEVASSWEFSVNPSTPGSRYGYNSYTRTKRIDGGLKRFEVFDPSYVFQGEVLYMDRDEVQNNAMELYRQHGEHTPFLWIPHPHDKKTWIRNSKMVNLAALGLFGYITDGYDTFPLNLEEYKG